MAYSATCPWATMAGDKVALTCCAISPDGEKTRAARLAVTLASSSRIWCSGRRWAGRTRHFWPGSNAEIIMEKFMACRGYQFLYVPSGMASSVSGRT